MVVHLLWCHIWCFIYRHSISTHGALEKSQILHYWIRYDSTFILRHCEKHASWNENMIHTSWDENMIIHTIYNASRYALRKINIFICHDLHLILTKKFLNIILVYILHHIRNSYYSFDKCAHVLSISLIYLSKLRKGFILLGTFRNWSWAQFEIWLQSVQYWPRKLAWWINVLIHSLA